MIVPETVPLSAAQLEHEPNIPGPGTSLSSLHRATSVTLSRPLVITVDYQSFGTLSNITPRPGR
jgi:hypothetical protein